MAESITLSVHHKIQWRRSFSTIFAAVYSVHSMAMHDAVVWAVYELMKISQIAQFVVVVHDADDDKWLKNFPGLFCECNVSETWNGNFHWFKLFILFSGLSHDEHLYSCSFFYFLRFFHPQGRTRISENCRKFNKFSWFHCFAASIFFVLKLIHFQFQESLWSNTIKRDAEFQVFFFLLS